MVKRTTKAVFTHPDLQPEKRMSLEEWLLQDGMLYETRTTPSEAPPDTPILDIIHEYFRELGQLDLLLALALEPSGSDSDVIYYISENILISHANAPANRAAQENLERYWDYRSEYWNNFQVSFVELNTAINRAAETSWSIHQFVDCMSKPRSGADITLLALLEKFYSSSWKIAFVLTSTFHLIKNVFDNTPDLENYNSNPVVIETYDFFRDHGFSINERGYQLNCIVKEVHDAQVKVSRELKSRRAMMVEDYPPPNSDGYWPAELIAAWVTTQWCTLDAKPITEKTVNSWKRRLFHNEYFHTQIHQRKHMIMLVDALRDHTHAGKRARRLSQKRTQFGH